MSRDPDVRALEELERIHGYRIDAILPDGTHRYWSTHCRHGNHDDCSATELAPGVPRRPAQCKVCGAPCQCHAPECSHAVKEA